MEEIINGHFDHIDQKLCQKALEAFYEIRKMDELEKKPSTSELVDWIPRPVIRSGIPHEDLLRKCPLSVFC